MSDFEDEDQTIEFNLHAFEVEDEPEKENHPAPSNEAKWELSKKHVQEATDSLNVIYNKVNTQLAAMENDQGSFNKDAVVQKVVTYMRSFYDEWQCHIVSLCHPFSCITSFTHTHARSHFLLSTSLYCLHLPVF